MWGRASRNARIPKWEKDEPKKRDLLPPEAWKIHLRDLVEVIAGPDQRKQGKVIKTEPKKMQVYVEGCNMRPVSELDKVTNPDRPRYAKVLKEAPLHYSDVMLVDPVDKRRCRVKYAYLESGKRVRLSARSGAVIPRVPKVSEVAPEDRPAKMWPDFTTRKEDVLELTYVPPL